jgi:hypothetical protein
MMRLALLLSILSSASALANECGEPGSRNWDSVVKLSAASVTLHWTGVYEGRDAVCGLSYQTSQGEARTLTVWGQPQVNKMESLIAFASCADDGCEKTILIADIVRGVVLKGVLPLSVPQAYFSIKWKGSSRTLSIDMEGIQGRRQRKFTCSPSDPIVCVDGEI